jgi:copper oxidase (laccase) domain-containing protein
MQTERLEQADRELAALHAGRREAVREIVVDAVHRGELAPSSRAFIVRVTGSTFLADVLTEAIAERAGAPRAVEPVATSDERAADPRDRVG